MFNPLTNNIMRQTFSVAFYCRESKVTKQGTAAIEMSIIINGKRSLMSLPMKMKPSEFSTLYSQKRNNPVKEFCSLYINKVNDVVRLIIENNKPLTPDNIKNVLANGIQNTYRLSELFKEHLSLVEEKTKGDLSYGTYRKYQLAFDEFINVVGDKEAKDVTNSDVERYINNISISHKPATVRGYANKVKSAYIQAIRDNKLRTNPFNGIKIRNPREKIEIITNEEYEKIREKRFDIDRLEKVRQLFILGCNCGLSFCDLMTLKLEDVNSQDGVSYIVGRRQKTGVKYTAVILEDGLNVLKNLNEIKMSNQKCNSYLKEIADLCGIKRRLNFHQSRHFYITTLLRKNINVGIVQQCAGHSKITMTERYLHVLQDDVINAFK